MILFIKLIKESAIFAASAIIANKLRTILTLLGITIGIFSIISVFSVVDALERQVRSSIESLGDNVIYIEKWPWQFGGDYQWWRYVNRPAVRISELDDLMRRTYTVEAATFQANTSRTVEYMNMSVENVSIIGVSAAYDQVRLLDIEDGRFFSLAEFSAGRNVAVIGNDLATNLFPNTDPVGRDIKVFGRKAQVIGVLKKEGMSNFGNSQDEMVILPVHYLNQFIDINNERYNPIIMAKGKPGVSNDAMIGDLTGAMRAIRRIKPISENNFALNEASLLTEGFKGLFSAITLAGWIIGGFSILVGGFGIANIMFVSVRERISIIGIQKAMGAKNYFILWQFLFEAVLLSVAGGLVGLLMVYGGSKLVQSLFELDFALTVGNIMLGINVSAIIGLVSGFIPAWTASRLDPVEAIRSTG